YFGQRIMGTVFGAATMVSAIGMAFGPLAGGFVYDTFSNYGWLYIGSAAVALGAMAIALAFPPLPSRARQGLAPGEGRLLPSVVLLVVDRAVRVIEPAIEHGAILRRQLTAVARPHAIFLALDRHFAALELLGFFGRQGAGLDALLDALLL